VAAFLLPWLARKSSRKAVHSICLASGGLGLASMFVVQDYRFLLVSMLGVGLAWASILSMPYAILAGALPKENVGVYMGIFNFFIVIPQLLAASVLGLLLRVFFHAQPIYALMMGGASLVIAGLCVLRVEEPNVAAEVAQA